MATCIDDLTDPEELSRFKDDFELIALYLDLKIAKENFRIMGVKGVGLDICKNEIHDIYANQLPRWAIDILNRKFENGKTYGIHHT